MDGYTTEQINYITYNKIAEENNNTVLLACAGSGKTQCIVMRMLYLLKNNISKPEQLLLLTFSKNTQSDFVRRLNKVDTEKLINVNNIRTIDSFAKLIIDKDNNIDVNLLSFTFMKYLEDNNSESLSKNKMLKNLKEIFVDEAQDLNEIQFNIIDNLQKKLNISVNMVGDPNQNIYQFRNSSDKYLMNFQGKRFYLTHNFRSSKSIIEFSKYLRPYQETDIIQGNKTLSDVCNKPTFMFIMSDSQYKECITEILKQVKAQNINLKDCAILAPTRGGMYSAGSSGLCIVTNILSKLKIKFKQWYEEADEMTGSVLTYEPVDDHINILTYMGSKGLEWKMVIVIDADICLINKNQFSEAKHNHDRYLLYVACSRASENMCILTRYRENRKTNSIELRINPWFKHIPSNLYETDGDFNLIFPEIIPKNKIEVDRCVTKLINNLTAEQLYYLSNIINNNIKKEVSKIFSIKHDDSNFISPLFLGRYIEAIFIVFYNLHKKGEKIRFKKLEDIIYCKKGIKNRYLKKIFIDWLESATKSKLLWEQYEADKNTNKVLYTDELVEQINKHMDKKIEIYKHVIINNNYYEEYIFNNLESFRKIYDEYLKTKNKKILIQSIYKIVLIQYAVETQHYFHITNDGEKFKDIFILYKSLIDKVIKFAKTTNENFIANNYYVFKDSIEGEIDLLTEDNRIFEIKCVKELNLKHVLQVITYNLLMFDYDENKEESGKEEHTINLYFYNLYKGEKVIFTVTSDKLNEIIRLFNENINKILS